MGMVMLHVYSIGTSAGCQTLNSILRPFGTGLFHCGIEVYNWEWSYSDTSLLNNPAITGVFCCKPRACEGHTYYLSEQMGTTTTLELEVLRLITLLEKKWPGLEYDVLKRNCGHFCNELCRMMGVGPLPEWVTSLAKMGAQVLLKAQKNCRAPICCCSDSNIPTSTLEDADFIHAVP